jgi:hypothetical protein
MLVTALVLVHVLSAFAFVAGYVATNVLTEIARRHSDLQERRTVLGLSGAFDRRFVRTGGTLVGVSGVVLVAIGGWSWTAPWIWLSTVVYAAILILGIGVWGSRGGRVEAALVASDEATVDRLLTERPFVILSRIENIALLFVICLMVLRPT